MTPCKGSTCPASAGEIVALTGANGAGKTTLAMLLCGLFKERGGQVAIDGLARKAKERVRLCRLVLQEADHQLFTESAYARNCTWDWPDSDQDHGQVMDLLEAIGLGEKAHQPPPIAFRGRKATSGSGRRPGGRAGDPDPG